MKGLSIALAFFLFLIPILCAGGCGGSGMGLGGGMGGGSGAGGNSGMGGGTCIGGGFGAGGGSGGGPGGFGTPTGFNPVHLMVKGCGHSPRPLKRVGLSEMGTPAHTQHNSKEKRVPGTWAEHSTSSAG